MSKPAHVERMESELAELIDRVDKLDVFMGGRAIFPNLPAVDQDLLRAQSGAMKAYKSILTLRLARATA